ncbi:fluoride efflux transporter FluC [Actinomadura atramentaria]|uniref:fluoride efflux transporter FluC n=1 Tax=Actinomadura atramentaria TaxID=1990 RepID=UPI000376F1AD|nr:CrcB family protein [Actinomadura atramentaria]
MAPPEPPVDPDIDLDVPAQRLELRRAPWGTLAAIAAGGALGALARYGIGGAFPHGAGEFAWATFWINVSGCFLIGVLMVLILETFEVHPLTRPFLGVGVLGGYTTFSTYAVDFEQAVRAGSAGTALAYLAGTAVAALVAVWTGVTAARAAARLRGGRA